MFLALLIERTAGNITRMAALMKSSRKVVRDRLKAAGLYDLDPQEQSKS